MDVNTVHNRPLAVTIFGAGPVGRDLVGRLALSGAEVRLVSRSGTSAPGATAVRGDASDPAFAASAAEGADVVVNAANAPYVRWDADLPPLFGAILGAAERNGARYVMLDNLYMYGPASTRGGAPMREDSPDGATDPKGVLRAQLARDVWKAHAAGRVRAAILRASDFFGPGVTNAHLGERAFTPLLAGRSVLLMGHPNLPHALSYTLDVARALEVLVRDPGGDGRVWHVPGLDGPTPREVLRRAAELAGLPEPKIAAVPVWAARLMGTMSPMIRALRDVEYQWREPYRLDSCAFAERFSFEATPPDDALRATIASYAPEARPVAVPA